MNSEAQLAGRLEGVSASVTCAITTREMQKCTVAEHVIKQAAAFTAITEVTESHRRRSATRKSKSQADK